MREIKKNGLFVIAWMTSTLFAAITCAQTQWPTQDTPLKAQAAVMLLTGQEGSLEDQVDEVVSWVPFAAGSWSFQTYGSVSVGDENGEMYTGHIGVGYYLWDNFSINLEAVGGYLNIEEGRNSEGSLVGLDLLIRHHLIIGDGWTIYFDGGGGIQQTSEPFPSGGTHFNFRPQGGLGVTLNLSDSAMFMGGVRWIHVSNASKDGQDNNPGYDSAQIYAGMIFSF